MLLMSAILILSDARSSGTGGWEEAVRNAAVAEGINSTTLLSICTVESSGRHWVVNDKEPGGKASYGLCQIQEATARDLGFSGPVYELLDAATNAKYAARFYRTCVRAFRGQQELAIACYNAGPFGVRRCVRAKGTPCNQDYVRKVMHEYRKRAGTKGTTANGARDAQSRGGS